MKKLMLSIVFAAMSATALQAQDITGTWQGSLQPPGAPSALRLVMKVTNDANQLYATSLTDTVDITVNDAHGPMRNLLPETLHPAARLIRGKPKQMGMLEGLTPEHDAVICVGYHSRAGALGVLSHSFMGHEIEDIWMDGRPVGEIGQGQVAETTGQGFQGLTAGEH